ncbi:hypothetical protein EST38_g2530 [Candolleomyces aberdarensis]|uniref:RecQ mediated genome instability protein 1 OB-fold domain-containing protein n=1 Tax=Candolleomyces aberdarensis TaxID=2316362 RepID=A0A4Q2DWH6_9AGAR|nr:hypothetical protein EST38_g2530 [Candolleomyces aberdarensis]
MQPGTGLPRDLELGTKDLVLQGPIVLEVTHMVELGVSPFEIEKIRLERETIMLSHYTSALKSCSRPSVSSISDWEFALPAYPKKTLRVYLTDGVTEIAAVELEPLPYLSLSHSTVGMKVIFLLNLVSPLIYLTGT